MHKKEHDGSVVVGGCESFKHSEKCEGCDKYTNLAPPMYGPTNKECDCENPGRIVVEPRGPQVLVSQEMNDLWTSAESDSKEGPGGALNVQIGGNHYKDFPFQPVEFIVENKIAFLPGSVIKRMCRYDKGTGKGLEDLRKAKHEIDLLIELEEWIDGNIVKPKNGE